MTHLVAAGHDVRAVSYDRGHANLAGDFDVFEVEGLHISTVDNRVSVTRTFTENLSRLSEGVSRFREMKRACFDEFEPEVVITDFEPTTAYVAMRRELPLVTLDNQHRMRYMRYPCPEQLKKDALVTEAVIRLIVPRPDLSLVTTFYFGEVTNDRTLLFPPILRREVLALEPSRGEHVLVYFTQDFDRFLPHLRAHPDTPFSVYGYDREEQDGNLAFRRASRDGFLRDLASARAVIATAGFTLMTEALHLKKPYLALPMAGQFEQELNALLLEDMGCGLNGRDGGPALVGDFLGRLSTFDAALAELPPSDDNRALLEELDRLLADGGAAAREAHERRR
jgi:uncharacterized protein (TIGR00661 family)